MLRQGLRELLDRVDKHSAEEGGGGGQGGVSSARSGSRGRAAVGRGDSRGGRPRGTGGVPGGGRPPQPGDWACRGCKFSPNFARRKECFECGRPRSPRGGGRAAGGSGAANATRGPIGAGGQRPLLGGRAGPAASATGATRARTDEPPSYRVPGASVAAARTLAAGGANTWANAVKGTTASAAATTTQRGTTQERAAAGRAGTGSCVDDDGFQQVVRKGRKARAADHDGPGTRDDDRPSPMDTTDDDAGGGPSSGDADALGEQDGDDPPSTPADLQRAWRDEIALIRKLRSQGVQDGHPAMRAAIEARDAAEQAWRTSKDPAPPAVRLGRAQSKLDRAEALQSEARAAMQEEERCHRERMATLQETLDECTERVATRRRQVQEIQAEVGAAGGADSGLQRAQRAAIEAVHGTICEEVGPTLAALAEQVGTDTPAWATLNSLLAKLADSKATLESATAPPAESFHIGEGDDPWEAGTEWSESHDMEGQRWGQGHTQQGHCQREQQATDDSTHDDHVGSAGWWGGSPARRWCATTRWQTNGHGHWSKASWADQHEDAMDDDDDGGGQPPTARRRVEGKGDEDAQRRQATQAHQQPPPAAQQPSASGTSDDAQERQRKHHERINQIITLAVESGVTPLTSNGEELHLLGPEQLEEWVAACLPAALLV